MERSESRKNPIVSTGVTSVVLIFVLLCMLTFSALSLVSAQADLRLSRKSAERTTAYYAAENAANELRIRVEQAASQAMEEGLAGDLAGAVLERLGGGSGLSLEGETLSYQVPVTEEEVLLVRLRLSPEGEDGLYSRVLVWKTESHHDWSPDESLDLLDLSRLPELG